MTWHIVLPSTEEELALLLQQRATKEAKRQLAAEEAARQRMATGQLGADPPEVVQAGIVATFGRKAREASLAAGATMDQTVEAQAAEAKATLSAASSMRE